MHLPFFLQRLPRIRFSGNNQRQFAVLVMACILSISVQAQKKQNGYIGIDAGIDLIKKEDPAFSARFSGNIQLGPGIFAGGQVGVIKFQSRDGVTIPLQLKLTALTASDPKKVSGLVLVEPGYGIYHNNAGTEPMVGGFVFYGGLGATFPGNNKAKAFITVGYSLYTFVGDHKSRSESVGIRVGIMI